MVINQNLINTKKGDKVSDFLIDALDEIFGQANVVVIEKPSDLEQLNHFINRQSKQLSQIDDNSKGDKHGE